MNTLEQEHYYLTSYAQNREDLFVRAIFGENYKGFYIDVGSNHPIHHSVTKLLYRTGWHGINIDPNQELMELTEYDRPLDVQLRCGVGNKRSKLTFRQYHNHGLSTFSEDMQRNYSDQSSEFTDEYEDIEVDMRTLADICSEHKVTNFDLLKVDVEGYEQEVLAGNDWQRFRPKVICIEANHKIDDWHTYLSERGYKVKTTDGLNDYYVDELCELADAPIRLAETALIYPHIVDNDVAGLIALQHMRTETYRIIHDAMRTPNRKASVRLLKDTVRISLQELKFLLKDRSRPPRVAFAPSRTVSAPREITDLKGYIKQTDHIYGQSFAAIRQYEQSLIPKSKTAAIAKRAKMVGYDVPRLVLGEVGRVARRRMR